MKRQLAIGINDFRRLREEGYYYVDKTLLIRDFLASQDDVSLITRPRRFGKTLNLTMMREFFDISKNSTNLFYGLEIMETVFAKQLNTLPVIFLTFDNCSGETFKVMKNNLVKAILREYERYRALFGGSVKQNAKQYHRFTLTYDKLRGDDVTDAILESSLSELMEAVYAFYKRRPIVLIDEYDRPLMKSYEKGYYDVFAKLYGRLLERVLSKNEFLGQALLVGTHPVTAESFFSGLKPFPTYTVSSEQYASYFGLTTDEAIFMLAAYGKDITEKISDFYNGYIFGGIQIYNPRSLSYYINKKEMKNYWENISTSILIRTSDEGEARVFAEEIEKLLPVGKIETFVNLEVSLVTNILADTLWGMLVNAGYLTIVEGGVDEMCTLMVPNLEAEEEIRKIKESYTGVAPVSANKISETIQKRVEATTVEEAAKIEEATKIEKSAPIEEPIKREESAGIVTAAKQEESARIVMTAKQEEPARIVTAAKQEEPARIVTAAKQEETVRIVAATKREEPALTVTPANVETPPEAEKSEMPEKSDTSPTIQVAPIRGVDPALDQATIEVEEIVKERKIFRRSKQTNKDEKEKRKRKKEAESKGAVESKVESVSEPKAESVPESKWMKEPKAESVPEPEWMTEPKAESVPEPEWMTEPKAESVPEPEWMTEPKTESVPEPEWMIEPKAESVPEPEWMIEPKAESVPEPEWVIELKVEGVSKPEWAIVPKIEKEPEAEEATKAKEEKAAESKRVIKPKKEKEVEPEKVIKPKKEREVEPEKVIKPKKEREVEPEKVIKPKKEKEAEPEKVIKPKKEKEAEPEKVIKPRKEREAEPEKVIKPRKEREAEPEKVIKPKKEKEAEPEKVIKPKKEREAKPSRAIKLQKEKESNPGKTIKPPKGKTKKRVRIAKAIRNNLLIILAFILLLGAIFFAVSHIQNVRNQAIMGSYRRIESCCIRKSYCNFPLNQLYYP